MTVPLLNPIASMKLGVRFLAVIATVALWTLPGSSVSKAQTQELDAYWAEVARTVVEGDFEGYAALYHEDAVLVSNFSESSIPIANALAGWKQGFIDTQEGKMSAEVSFRFSQRYNDGATAHETGIFRYAYTPSGGELVEQLVHFEALLVKKDGWKMVMEYQKSPATAEDWNNLQ